MKEILDMKKYQQSLIFLVYSEPDMTDHLIKTKVAPVMCHLRIHHTELNADLFKDWYLFFLLRT